jgi:hypothetical protein
MLLATRRGGVKGFWNDMESTSERHRAPSQPPILTFELADEECSSIVGPVRVACVYTNFPYHLMRARLLKRRAAIRISIIDLGCTNIFLLTTGSNKTG